MPVLGAPTGHTRGEVGSVQVVLAVDFSTVMWWLGAVILFFFLWFAGTGILRSMSTPLPPPPPAGEMRRVNVRYRCSVCGLEIKLTLAPDEDPPPPKHCLEEMVIQAPLYD
jgi:hypothetical protein